MSEIKVSTFGGALAELDVDVLLLPVFEAADSASPWESLDEAVDSRISEAIASRPFSGKLEKCLAVPLPTGGGPGEIVLVGLGEAGKLTSSRYREAIAGGTSLAVRRHGERIAIAAREDAKFGAEHAAATTEAVLLSQYRFDRYKKPDEDATRLAELLLPADDGVDEAIERTQHICRAVTWARDLINLSPSEKRPPVLADLVAEMAAEVGLGCEIIDEARARELNMGALLAVAQGSDSEPRLVVLEHAPDTVAAAAPIVLVGKGVTFDTGGISIKPSGGMEDMKWDMGGSGVVIGLMRALARRKAKVNVVGLVGLVENMPSGTAQRPGDVVTSMSGQTIEVINTDAEGRLVLADALWYTQKRFKPRFMVDLATLTGAIIVSLGHRRAGMFANDQKLSDRLLAAGDAVDEKVWPMPMDDGYDKDIDCDIADMKNVGAGRGAGSVSAAKFLERFVNKVPWAHLDIAGVTWSKAATDVVPKGGTAFGVRLLDRLVADHYEGK